MAHRTTPVKTLHGHVVAADCHYGLLVVFVSVFLDQGGIPIPAYPPIIVTDRDHRRCGHSWWPVCSVSRIAAVLRGLAVVRRRPAPGRKLVQLDVPAVVVAGLVRAHTRGIYARWGAAR
jgi:hypothetical protein